MIRVILLMITVSIIFLGACTPQETPEVFDVTPVPSDYVEYKDEANYFNISYPPDWVVDQSLIKDPKFQEYMDKAYSGVPIEATYPFILFMAGVPTGMGGYSPNVIVVATPFSGKAPNLEAIVEESTRQEKAAYTEYLVLFQERTLIDGMEAIIKENQAHRADGDVAHQLQMVTIVNKAIWYVVLTTRPTEFASYEEDFYHVIRSLRITK